MATKTTLLHILLERLRKHVRGYETASHDVVAELVDAIGTEGYLISKPL